MTNAFTTANRHQQTINNGARIAGSAATLGGVSIIADSPRRVAAIDGFGKFLVVLRTLILLVATGAAWSFVPALGAILAVLGVFYIARATAAMKATPLRVGAFFRQLPQVVPTVVTLSAGGVVAASVVYRSIVIEWLPEWLRTIASGGAALAAIGFLAYAAPAIGIRAVRAYRADLRRNAEVQASIAVMLGANPRALFEPSPMTGQVAADWNYGRDDTIVVDPQADVDLSSVASRLASTRLGQEFEIAHADHDTIVLAPISDETLERQRQRAQSGGLIEGQHDLARDEADPVEITPTFEVSDDDDPWGNEPIAAPATETADPFAFGEEDWK